MAYYTRNYEGELSDGVHAFVDFENLIKHVNSNTIDDVIDVVTLTPLSVDDSGWDGTITFASDCTVVGKTSVADLIVENVPRALAVNPNMITLNALWLPEGHKAIIPPTCENWHLAVLHNNFLFKDIPAEFVTPRVYSTILNGGKEIDFDMLPKHFQTDEMLEASVLWHAANGEFTFRHPLTKASSLKPTTIRTALATHPSWFEDLPSPFKSDYARYLIELNPMHSEYCGKHLTKDLCESEFARNPKSCIYFPKQHISDTMCDAILDLVRTELANMGPMVDHNVLRAVLIIPSHKRDEAYYILALQTGYVHLKSIPVEARTLAVIDTALSNDKEAVFTLGDKCTQQMYEMAITAFPYILPGIPEKHQTKEMWQDLANSTCMHLQVPPQFGVKPSTHSCEDYCEWS